jgi:hypothetical protein
MNNREKGFPQGHSDEWINRRALLQRLNLMSSYSPGVSRAGRELQLYGHCDFAFDCEGGGWTPPMLGTGIWIRRN